MYVCVLLTLIEVIINERLKKLKKFVGDVDFDYNALTYTGYPKKIVFRNLAEFLPRGF